ncbi:SAM-dependent methyltransferase [Streptomyces zagrosensis]|uniref:SAM-dependent methyltransferase n=1 Tax=Streptomyces zagrosensis TaxID=1042984 RepID=A0A7W9V2D3_9ACTN|nr:SAM-dependent methyltransferase [Streptomyces zagrosensis]MBB5938729.1 hypothetical protein [Streptomyces zagrosensis]
MYPEEYPLTQPIDVHTASAARMYDFLLAGVNNYAVDRAACQELLAIAPSAQRIARTNRDFLQRVVRVLVEDYGIDQFLDHGSGLPTQENVHQIAQRINPQCKVAYIDDDPMVLAHGRTQLHENHNTMVLHADMRSTQHIVEKTEGFIDFRRPVAALFISVLHCLPDSDDDSDPAALIQRVAKELKGGGLMVVCQLVSEDPAVRQGVTDLMRQATKNHWGRVRTPEEVRGYFSGMTTLDPGLVDVVDWRPDIEPPPPHLRPTDWVEWGGVAQL